MKRAAYQRAFRDRTIIDITLANGYEYPESRDLSLDVKFFKQLVE